MSDLVFNDLNAYLEPILIPLIQALEGSKWKIQCDWLNQIATYRHYPDYNMLIIKLKKCQSPDFYKTNLYQSRVPFIYQAMQKHLGGKDSGKVLIKIFGHNESAVEWMKENRKVNE